MPHIELPRALEDYFAFAELTPTRNGRRFTISLPYFNGQRIDRLQWWYHVSSAQEQMQGEGCIAAQRALAVQRFIRHIERWLANTGQRLYGDEPIPHIGPVLAPVEESREPAHAVAPPEVVSFPREKVANG